VRPGGEEAADDGYVLLLLTAVYVLSFLDRSPGRAHERRRVNGRHSVRFAA
jgi:hypothetical protein